MSDQYLYSVTWQREGQINPDQVHFLTERDARNHIVAINLEAHIKPALTLLTLTRRPVGDIETVEHWEVE